MSRYDILHGRILRKKKEKINNNWIERIHLPACFHEANVEINKPPHLGDNQLIFMNDSDIMYIDYTAKIFMKNGTIIKLKSSTG